MTRKWARAAALRGIRTSARGDEWQWCPCLWTDLYKHILQIRAKHNNQEKKYPFIEGRSDKNFRVVNLFTGSIFAIILFCTVMLFGSQAWSSLSFVPPGWGANSSQNCRSCSFCSHKQRCWTVLSELWYEVASNLNTFFLSWKQRTAVKVVENARQYIKMYAAGVWAKTAKGYFKTVEEQVILLQSKVWSNL